MDLETTAVPAVALTARGASGTLAIVLRVALAVAVIGVGCGDEEPAIDIRVVISEPMNLCANANPGFSGIPTSFLDNTRLELPAGEHELGPRATWPKGDADEGIGDPPRGRDLDLGAQVQFPNIDAETYVFGEGNWAAVEDTDLHGWHSPGETAIWPSAHPRSEDAPLSAATLVLRAAGVPDARGRLELGLAESIEQSEGFQAFVACDNQGKVGGCSIGGVSRDGGFGMEVVPCGFPSQPVRRRTVMTQRGTLSFETQYLNHSPALSAGMSIVVRADGSFDGVTFAQDDLMQLSMQGSDGFDDPPPLGVLFPAPISGVCGVMVEYLGFINPDDPLDPHGQIAYPVTCELERGEPFEVFGYTETWLDP